MTRKREHDDGKANTSFRIPRDLLAQIDALCEERMVGRSFLIERLLRRGLQHLPSIDPAPTVEPFPLPDLMEKA